MALIDPEGLYNGARMRACSNSARFYFPYLFLLCNGFGRFEIDMDRILTRAFITFDPIPPRAEIHEALEEYSANHLIFIYESRGQLWGQWDCPKGTLPTYQTKADKRTPEPPEPDFTRWRSDYQEQKRAGLAIFGKTKDLGRKTPVFAKEQPTSENISERTENFSHSIGIGIGEGIGEGTGSALRGQSLPEALKPTRVVKPAEAAAAAQPEGTGVGGAETGDLFDRYWQLFVEAGKPLNDRDRHKAAICWLSAPEEDQSRAYADAKQRLSDGTWPDAQRTQFPHNHLADKPWTRVAAPRTLPTILRRGEAPDPYRRAGGDK